MSSTPKTPSKVLHLVELAPLGALIVAVFLMNVPGVTLDSLVVLLSVLTPFVFVPQTLRVWKLRKDAHALQAISLTSTVFVATVSLLCIFHAFVSDSLFLRAGYINFALSVTVGTIIIRSRIEVQAAEEQAVDAMESAPVDPNLPPAPPTAELPPQTSKAQREVKARNISVTLTALNALFTLFAAGVTAYDWATYENAKFDLFPVVMMVGMVISALAWIPMTRAAHHTAKRAGSSVLQGLAWVPMAGNLIMLVLIFVALAR